MSSRLISNSWPHSRLAKANLILFSEPLASQKAILDFQRLSVVLKSKAAGANLGFELIAAVRACVLHNLRVEHAGSIFQLRNVLSDCEIHVRVQWSLLLRSAARGSIYSSVRRLS